MASRVLTIRFDELGARDLSAEEAELCASAKRATALAYAPYSGFRVGAAARLRRGLVVSAANLENAAYPQCLCAEATLLGSLHSQHSGEPIAAVAVAAVDRRDDWHQAAPCGSCRQQLHEALRRQGEPFAVYLADGAGGALRFGSVADLLPLGFSLDGATALT